jgi:hypothetical protein
MVQYSVTRLKDQSLETGAMNDSDHPQAVGGSEGSLEGHVTAVDQRAFRDGYEPAAGDVFIAILGVTGAGKVVLLLRCLSACNC